MGWEKLREEIFANQKRLGVIPANTQLTPWPDVLPKWDSLSVIQKKLYAHEAEVFAAYAAYTDHEIGRVIQAVEDMGKLDNTLIIYISGDNGNSAEGTLEGTPNQMTAYNGILKLPEVELMRYYESWGSDKTYPHMSVAWSWAFDTPFKWTKQVASHFGGTRQGMAISWPGHINDVGGIRSQFHHMIDIVPTILEATGVKEPTTVNGIAQRPIEGVSMAYTFDKANANAPSKRETQYFEMFANRAIYHQGWVAATTPPAPPWELGTTKLPGINDYKWELYNITEDFSEYNDLAATNPDKLKELQALFLTEAAKYNVFPIDNSILPRIITPRPSATAGRTVFTYHRSECRHSCGQCSQPLEQGLHHHRGGDYSERRCGRDDRHHGRRLRRLWAVPAQRQAGLRLQPPQSEAIPLGGRGGSEDLMGKALAPGKHTIVFDFKYDGPGPGKGGTGVLSVDGKELSRKTMEHSIPFLMSIDETFDIGSDTRTPVDDSYKLPFHFTGKIDKLTFKLGPEQLMEADHAAKAEALASVHS